MLKVRFSLNDIKLKGDKNMSAATITTFLAGLGGIVGGGMAAGIGVVGGVGVLVGTGIGLLLGK